MPFPWSGIKFYYKGALGAELQNRQTSKILCSRLLKLRVGQLSSTVCSMSSIASRVCKEKSGLWKPFRVPFRTQETAVNPSGCQGRIPTDLCSGTPCKAAAPRPGYKHRVFAKPKARVRGVRASRASPLSHKHLYRSLDTSNPSSSPDAWGQSVDCPVHTLL